MAAATAGIRAVQASWNPRRQIHFPTQKLFFSSSIFVVVFFFLAISCTCAQFYFGFGFGFLEEEAARPRDFV